jgi:hypothetical protein
MVALMWINTFYIKLYAQYFHKHKKSLIQKMQYPYFWCLFAIEIYTTFAMHWGQKNKIELKVYKL